jgi:hypothetical protein
MVSMMVEQMGLVKVLMLVLMKASVKVLMMVDLMDVMKGD